MQHYSVADSDSLGSFVPEIVLQHFLRQALEKNDKVSFAPVPYLKYVYNTCLAFVDLSGFTRFAEQCSTMEGGAGIGKLNIALNSAMDRMIKSVERYGGDILKFAGDAIIVMFTMRDEKGWINDYQNEALNRMSVVESMEDTELQKLVLGAIQSVAFDLQRSFEGDPIWGVHSCIGIGSLQIMHAGGHKNRFEFLPVGKCVKMASDGLDLAKKGETVVHDAVLNLLENILDVEKIEDSQYHKILNTGKVYAEKTSETPVFNLSKLIKTETEIKALCMGIATFVQRPVLMNLQNIDSLKEIRTVTTVFIQITLTAESFDITNLYSHDQTSLSLRMASLKRNKNVRRPNVMPVRTTLLGTGVVSGSPRKSVTRRTMGGSRVAPTETQNSPPLTQSIILAAASDLEGGVTSMPGSNDVENSPKPLQVDAMSRMKSSPKMGQELNTELLMTSSPKELTADPFTKGEDNLANPQQGIQGLFYLLQVCVADNKGLIRQFIVDDKGCVLIALFGMGGSSSTSQSSCAVSTALTMRSKVAKYNTKLSIGITTGRVYCGTVGNNTRREYTVIGGPVNKAARLMAKSKYDVYVDEDTKLNSLDTHVFEDLPPITIKGYDGPVKVFRPIRRIGILGNDSTSLLKDQKITVGQTDILAKMEMMVKRLSTTNCGGLYVLKGISGIGKTHMLYTMKDISEAENIVTIMTSAALEEFYTPYFSFRTILRALFNLDLFNSLSAEERVGYLKFQLRATYKSFADQRKAESPNQNFADEEEVEEVKLQKLMQLFPLLKDVFDGNLHLPMTPVLLEMDAADRASRLQDLIYFILCKLHHLVITIENANYLDDVTFQLLKRLLKNKELNILIVFTINMDSTSELPNMIKELLELASPHNIPEIEGGVLPLLNLSRELVTQLISYHNHVESWPPEVIDFVMEVGRGNPVYSMQVVQLLKRKNVVNISNSICCLNKADGSDLDTVRGSLDSVDAIIVDRLNDLTPEEKEFIKACSVAGNEFSVNMVSSILPLKISSNQKKIDLILDVLCDLGFLRCTKKSSSMIETGKTVYKFDSNLIRNIIYNMNGESDARKKMHRRLANHLYSLNSDDLATLFPVLAYHYQEAGELEKAIKSYDMAAKNSLYAGFYQKVVSFLQQAIALGEGARMSEFENIPFPQYKLIQWERQISICYAKVGQVEEAASYKQKVVDRCQELNIEVSSVQPFFSQNQKVNNRRQAVDIKGRNRTTLVSGVAEVLANDAARHSAVTGQEKKNSMEISNLSPTSLSDKLIEHEKKRKKEETKGKCIIL